MKTAAAKTEIPLAPDTETNLRSETSRVPVYFEEISLTSRYEHFISCIPDRTEQRLIKKKLRQYASSFKKLDQLFTVKAEQDYLDFPKTFTKNDCMALNEVLKLYQNMGATLRISLPKDPDVIKRFKKPLLALQKRYAHTTPPALDFRLPEKKLNSDSYRQLLAKRELSFRLNNPTRETKKRVWFRKNSITDTVNTETLKKIALKVSQALAKLSKISAQHILPKHFELKDDLILQGVKHINTPEQIDLLADIILCTDRLAKRYETAIYNRDSDLLFDPELEEPRPKLRIGRLSKKQQIQLNKSLSDLNNRKRTLVSEQTDFERL